MTVDTEKMKALALAYVYENGDHWYSEHQVSDGISYEPASDFIVGCDPATVLELITEVERLKNERDLFRLGHSNASNRCCELESEVELLRAEVERLEEGMKIAINGLQNIAAIEARAAPAAGTEKDAERYRWLRDEARAEYEERIFVTSDGHKDYYEPSGIYETELDDAIDAAIDAHKARKEQP